MTNLQKYTIAAILRASIWWIAVGPLYFFARGLSPSEVYSLVATYSLSLVVLEFPTGVIADTFSRKYSVLVGWGLSTLSLLLMIVPGGFHYYLSVYILAGLGSSLSSGSSMAILHNISNNFQKDLAYLKSLNFLWITFTGSVGAWLFKINIVLPFALTAFTSLLAIFCCGG